MAMPDGSGNHALRRRLARAAPVLLLTYAVGRVAVSALTVDSAALALALSVASWLLFTAVVLAAVAGLVAAEVPRRGVWAMLFGGGAAWAALTYLVEPPHEVPWLGHVLGLAATLAMILGTVGLGRAIGWLLKEPSLLPPALVLAGLVDLWGVKMGPVAKVASSSMETILRASAAVPAVGSTAASRFPLDDLTIGPGDLCVAALILAVAVNAGFDLRRNLQWMYGLMLLGLALALTTAWLVPGLVFLALAGCAANWREFRYTRDERRALLIATGLVLAVIMILTVILRA